MNQTTYSAEPVITARNLEKNYGSLRAVDDISFSVSPGQIVAILGPNGAGKTTTINMLTTLIPIDSGTANIAGYDITTEPRLARQLFGVAGQSAAVDEKLTARENLTMFGKLYKLPTAERRQRVDELIDWFDLQDFADRPAETYSGGQRRRLDVAAALVSHPPALFLDEPTTGLDPRSRRQLWTYIKQLAEQGTAIVLTTQYLEEADLLADYIYIIDRGRIVASGTSEALKQDLEKDILEVTLATPGDFTRALELLDDIRDKSKDRADLRITIPTQSDAARTLDILTLINNAGIQMTDFQRRRPTLDDVFLTMTSPTSNPKETS